MSARLSTDFNRCNINKLCTTIDQKCVVHCFPKAAPLEPIMNLFWIMTHKCKSTIFSNYWYDRLALVNRSRSSDLALCDIAEEVWSPVFDQCVKLLAELKDYSISLLTVNQLFEGQPIPTITSSIKQLYKGVELCLNGREVNDFKWMQGVVERMVQFWQLHGFAAAAQAFLEIRDGLKLTGDFQLVENVASQVGHKGVPGIWHIEYPSLPPPSSLLSFSLSSFLIFSSSFCSPGYQFNAGSDTEGY